MNIGRFLSLTRCRLDFVNLHMVLFPLAQGGASTLGEEEKKESKRKRAEQGEERAKKKARKIEQKRLEIEALKPVVKEHIEKGFQHVVRQNVPVLKQILI